jgi:hypothetical protein
MGKNIDSDGTADLLGQGQDDLVTDPKLGVLQDNGGFAQTHALLALSPAIDAGTTVGGAPAVDERGVTRDANVDIGAFESTSNILLVDTTSDVVDAPIALTITDLLNDIGPDNRISLREAILATNGTANGATPDEIHFNIPLNDPNHYYYKDDSAPGSLSLDVATILDDASIVDFDPDYPGTPHSWYRIRPGANPLDAITDAVILNATTQPGYSGTPVIELDGSLVTLGDENGLTIQGGGSTIRGLVINRCIDDGIEIEIAGNNTIEGNYIGTDITGTLDRGNQWGISVKSNGNIITCGAGCLVSGKEEPKAHSAGQTPHEEVW